MQGMVCQMSGAQSSRGTTEAQTNLQIALKLQNLLEQSGSTVILTRSDENAIYDIDSTTLREQNTTRAILWLANVL